MAILAKALQLVRERLGDLLASVLPGAEIAVMGPTASMLPDPLCRHGVRIVGGVWVRKPDEPLDAPAAGGSGYHFLDTLADRVVIESGPPFSE